jgi:hypothetical protein
MMPSNKQLSITDINKLKQSLQINWTPLEATLLCSTSNHFSANYHLTINLPMQSPNTQPLPHYHAKPTWDNGIGYLVDFRGIRLPGITTIMKATKSPKEKAQLVNWRQRSRSI